MTEKTKNAGDYLKQALLHALTRETSPAIKFSQVKENPDFVSLSPKTSNRYTYSDVMILETIIACGGIGKSSQIIPSGPLANGQRKWGTVNVRFSMLNKNADKKITLRTFAKANGYGYIKGSEPKRRQYGDVKNKACQNAVLSMKNSTEIAASNHFAAVLENSNFTRLRETAGIETAEAKELRLYLEYEGIEEQKTIEPLAL
ncbi:MAG: hypothetical protein AAF244_04440 [Pseudomonadota bacterium]